MEKNKIMSKPIFIVRFPYLENLDREKFEDYHKQIGEQLPDYRVLSLIDNSVDRVEFECYNSPHSELEFDELKQIILEKINWEPTVSDNFQIGPDGAFEYGDDISDWDDTLMDGLEEE